jgi:hypothetical protein
MAMLTALLDESDGRQLITKAEIMRELDRFELARALLSRVPRRHNSLAACLEDLVEKRDAGVREIQAPHDGDITIYV